MVEVNQFKKWMDYNLRTRTIFLLGLLGLTTVLGIGSSTSPPLALVVEGDQALLDLGLPGSGSLTSPFILTLTDPTLAVTLLHLTLHLSIQGSTLNHLYTFNITSGHLKVLNSQISVAHLVHSPGTLVRNSTFHSSTSALVVDNSNEVRVSNSSFSTSFIGLEVVDSPSVRVEDSTFSSTNQGIVSRNSSLSISGSSFTSNQLALLTSLGSDLTLSDSVFQDNQGDIYLTDHSSSNLSGNSFTGSLDVEYASATFDLNSFSGSQVTFFQSAAVVVTDNHFSGGSVHVLAGSDDLFVNNSFTDCPLTIQSSTNQSIQSNQWVFNTTATGLDLIDSSGVINDNSFTNSGVGLVDSLFSPHAYQFSNNQVNGLPLGFYAGINHTVLSEPHGQLILLATSSVSVINQSIHSTAPAGIQILNSTGVIISRSNLTNNYNGLSLTNSSLGEVSYNNFTGQVSYAIALSQDTSNITFHHNNFSSNNPSGVQVLDDGVNNIWYVAEEGNYWSDLSGRTTYPTAGSAGSVDLHPLLIPTTFPLTTTSTTLPTNTTDSRTGGEEGRSRWLAPVLLGSILLFVSLGLVVLLKGFSFSFKIGK